MQQIPKLIEKVSGNMMTSYPFYYVRKKTLKKFLEQMPEKQKLNITKKVKIEQSE